MPYVDVLIVGAGLSGIGSACHLVTDRPSTSFALLEARDVSGGTWDLFRYPGVRSDSDMFTLGYSFEPWVEAKAIADGPSILSYVRTTAEKYGVDRRIHYRRRVCSASWSGDDALWTVEVEGPGGSEVWTCRFLWGNTGYYRYDEGFRPEFTGESGFRGTMVHPQHWPEDLDVTGQQVVVVGSGATAVTLVPALAREAAHVTMLQRSPTYVVSRPAVDGFADRLRAVLPARWAHPVVRIKNVSLTLLSYVVSRRWPEVVKRGIRRGVAEALGETFDIDTHFTPRYNPWDQRLCLVPDGDLFEALKSSRASVVTDTISRFTPDGIELASGEHLDADVVVLATGLKLLFLGGIDLVVDGERVDPRSTIAYKGMMLCGVPNLVMTFGYTNASWTLKADLTAEYVIRLLDEMERRGVRQCTPMAPAGEETPAPFLDFSSGYVTRAIDDFPRQGAVAPWRLYQNYFLDMWLTRWRRIDDQLAFTNPAP